MFAEPDHYLDHTPAIATRACLVRRLVGSAAGKSLVDVGCGDGAVSRQFLRDVSGAVLIDIAPEMVARARQRLPPVHRDKVKMICADFVQPNPWRGDIVLCLGVLAYVKDVAAAVQSLSTMVNAGGSCIIAINDTDTAAGKLQWLYWHGRNRLAVRRPRLNALRRSRLVAIAQGHGLTLQRQFRHSLMLPGMGILPTSWLKWYDDFVARTPRLARFGSETLIEFRKN